LKCAFGNFCINFISSPKENGGYMKVSIDEVLLELSNLIGKDRAVILLLSQALEDGYGELIAIAHQDIEIAE
jgi:hypothetical protein